MVSKSSNMLDLECQEGQNPQKNLEGFFQVFTTCSEGFLQFGNVSPYPHGGFFLGFDLAWAGFSLVFFHSTLGFF